MMIAVHLNKKSEFDRLWKWAKTYMQHQSGASKDYFAWHCKTDGSILSENSASDGEEWFVMALVFASARWGDGEGIFAYKDEAPALSGWAYEKFGGFNSKFYEHVFELILRLKRNFLWPAM